MVLHFGQGVGKVDPVAMLSMSVAFICQPLCQAYQNGRQVLRKELGVKVLQQHPGGATGEVLDLQALFFPFVVLLDTPAQRIELGEKSVWIGLGIEQRSDQHFDLATLQLHSDQARLQRLGVGR